MVYRGPGPEWDSERWNRAVAGSQTATQRIEVWSEGIQLTESAPGLLDGTVVNDWVTAGISRSLNMTVEPSTSWLKWLALPSLEIRIWQGIRFSPRLTMECPLGVFPVQPPETSLPRSAIQIVASDYMEWVADADFSDKPVPRPAGRLTAAIGWLVNGSGLPAPKDLSTAKGSSGDVLLEGTRLDALDAAAKAAGVEVICDRVGDPVIIDAQVLGAPVSTLLTGTGGTCIGVQNKPDWSKVHNLVVVTSSAPDVDFGSVTASINWTGHPAHPYRLGSPQRPRYRVLHYSSPLLFDREQAQKAAATILAREAAVAETYVFAAFPDATREAGDSVLGATTVDGQTRVTQATQVTHPLRRRGAPTSQVTAASTLVDAA